MAIDGNTIDFDLATIGLVQSTEEMKEGALTASGRAAKSDGLAFGGFQVHAFEHSDGAFIVALPNAISAKNNTAGAR
jgi:hypothetical protein